MDVVLIAPTPISHRTAEENLGLGYLAAMLRGAKYSVEIIDGWLEGLSPTRLQNRIFARSDVPLWIGFSCYRSHFGQALETVQVLKSRWPKVPLVAGGYGPTFEPDLFLHSGFNIVVRGEGEYTVVQLSEHFRRGNPQLKDILGIAFQKDGSMVFTPRAPLITSLDLLPKPARDTLEYASRRKSTINVSSSRGCNANCLFCSIIAFERQRVGSRWRQRSIPMFVDELEMLADKGIRHFKIIDDSFIEPPRDRRWCADLADTIVKRGLKVHIRASVRADRIDSTILNELVRAGFSSFSCGIENFSQSALTRMNKMATLEQNVAALEAFEKSGVIVQAGHILFDKDVTMAELWENLRLMRAFEWTISKGAFTEMYAAEGTSFTRMLRRQNLFDKDSSILGNHKYPILDVRCRKVYGCMKLWHKAHMELYDKVIDPVSAPKAIDPDELRSFLPLCIELRRLDMTVFEMLLNLAENECSYDEMLFHTRVKIGETAHSYDFIGIECSRQYERLGLGYDGVRNPFVC